MGCREHTSILCLSNGLASNAPTGHRFNNDITIFHMHRLLCHTPWCHTLQPPCIWLGNGLTSMEDLIAFIVILSAQTCQTECGTQNGFKT